MPASATLLAGLLLTASPALAAEATELPDPLRGVAALAYDATGEKLRVLQADEVVGRSHLREHDLTLQLGFSPVRALALGFELPVVLDERLVWSEAHEMVFDPTLDNGSMLGTPAIDPPPVLKGGGLAGPLLLLRVAPFHTRLHAGRGDRTSWVLEAGYRFQDKSSFYKTTNDGKRGGGTGADALHLRSAWSTERRSNRPYLDVVFDRAFTVPTPLRATDGSILTAGAAVRPASRLDARIGTEVPAIQAEGFELAVDLRAHAGYRSWQDVPSGLYLPDVLDTSRSVLVTQGDALSLTGGLGLLFRAPGKLDVRVSGDAGTETPYQIEHPYGLYSGPGALVWAAGLTVRAWLSDALLGLPADAAGGS